MKSIKPTSSLINTFSNKICWERFIFVYQNRDWFYTLHAIGTIIFDSVAYKNVVSNGLVLDKNGHKMSKRLGNATDPFDTLGAFGPDATRWYMISNANPWDNLKFDLDGIDETQRKFFGTLQNTYNFFSLYANVDKFDPEQSDALNEGLLEIDKWILSRLHSLIEDVSNNLDAFEPTKAYRQISDFVQNELSNWYVRLCRRRFWKGEMGSDKLAAYQTLFTCLDSISKMIAPVSPFFSDQPYQDVNKTGKRELSFLKCYLGK
jgi:isoleucyl-tRNA synthetase